MTSAEPAQKHRFTVLDGLRGGAAIMVVIAHTSNYAPMAFLAVCFFFTLSGFVLAHGFAEKLQRRGEPGRGQKSRFVASRLIRLYPLYLAGTAIALLPAVQFVRHHDDFWSWKVYLQALAAAPFFIPLPYEYSSPLDMPAWTLPYELFANAVFLFAGWRWVPTLLIVLTGAPLMLWDSGDSVWGEIVGELPVVFYCFFLGVALCRAWCENLLPKFGLHPLAVLFILGALLAYPASSQPDLYAGVLTVVVLPLLVWVGACSTAKGGSAPLMGWLGMVSYGVYVLHFPIFMWVTAFDDWLRQYHPRLAGRIDSDAVLIVIPLALVAAHLLTTRLEAPLRKWLWAKYAASRFGGRRVEAPLRV